MNIAVIFAGGSGRRMRSNGIPKQFLQVNGVPIIIQTLRVFQESMDIDAIVLACVPEYMEHMKKLAARYEIDKLRRIVPGGETGQESIYFGLKAAQEIAEPGSIVLIHDGVRPLITEDTITDNIKKVEECGSCITCIPEHCIRTGIRQRYQRCPRQRDHHRGGRGRGNRRNGAAQQLLDRPGTPELPAGPDPALP